MSHLEFGIRDREKNLFRISETGVKKAPDPGSVSATLRYWVTLEADYYLHQEFGYVAFQSINPSRHDRYGNYSIHGRVVFSLYTYLGHFSVLKIGGHQINHKIITPNQGWIRIQAIQIWC